jgi:xanthine dehydrogenase small subunit
MRHEVIFYVNGKRHEVTGEAAFGSLADYLRDECRLVGTKIGCREGDCGACSLLIGRPEGVDSAIRYRAATSCILTLAQLDAAHVVTIEGLSDEGVLHPVQEAMVAHHGSQCGYCTPGFVVALCGLFEAERAPSEKAIKTALTGNLCRCTGYLPILEAARAVELARIRRLDDRYPMSGATGELAQLAREPLLVEANTNTEQRRYYRPVRISDAVSFKAEYPDAVVVSGGTDLGVWKTRQAYDPPFLLSLAGIAEWYDVRREGEAASIGANVTWTALEEFARKEAPPLNEVIHHFASPQIRNVATFVGNVASGSPIADSVSFLHVAGAVLELVGPQGTRTVPVGDFFTGYRQTVLSRDELIARIVVPLPGQDERVRLYKISKRKEMDISTFRASIRIRTRGAQIEKASIGFAGVGPKVLRLPGTESFLAGRSFDEASFREAGRRARAEVEPISDVRGSRDFRLILAENILLKYYYDCEEAGPIDAG